MDAINEFWESAFINSHGGTYCRGPLEGGFSYYIKCSLEGDTIEVPALAKAAAVEAKLSGYKNLIIPLVPNPGRMIERRQAARMLRDFSREGSLCELKGVKSPRGNKYYGMPGIICDEEMHLLVLCTCVIDIDEANHVGLIKKVNACLDYALFEYTDRILEKTFYHQYLKTIRDIYINYMPRVGNIGISPDIQRTMSVIIEDIDARFKETPPVPFPGSDFERSINDSLREFIESEV